MSKPGRRHCALFVMNWHPACGGLIDQRRWRMRPWQGARRQTTHDDYIGRLGGRSDRRHRRGRRRGKFRSARTMRSHKLRQRFPHRTVAFLQRIIFTDLLGCCTLTGLNYLSSCCWKIAWWRQTDKLQTVFNNIEDLMKLMLQQLQSARLVGQKTKLTRFMGRS